VEVFLPLLERLGIPLSFLAIAIIAFVRGDISPRYVVQRLQADLDRERRETDRFLDMCIRLLEDARDSQHVGREAVRAMKGFRESRAGENGEDREHGDRRQQSILDRGERMHLSDVKER
jgi:hypothetical protein